MEAGFILGKNLCISNKYSALVWRTIYFILRPWLRNHTSIQLQQEKIADSDEWDGWNHSAQHSNENHGHLSWPQSKPSLLNIWVRLSNRYRPQPKRSKDRMQVHKFLMPLWQHWSQGHDSRHHEESSIRSNRLRPSDNSEFDTIAAWNNNDGRDRPEGLHSRPNQKHKFEPILDYSLVQATPNKGRPHIELLDGLWYQWVHHNIWYW